MRNVGAGVAACFLVFAAACSTHRMGIDRMAAALAASGAVYESDDDPEFVRLAAPGTLKTVEMLLSQSPDHPQLLLTACSGFTEYSYAFLHMQAELEPADTPDARELRRRAGAMYRRARAYCLRGLRAAHSRLTEQALLANPTESLTAASASDVPLLYWTAAAWGSELLLARDNLKRLGELATVRALLGRARALNDRWQDGAIYEALIALDALPPILGGSPAAARADFDRAVELSHGRSVFAYVAMSAAVTDAAEKRRLLEQAVKIDVNQLPARRLTNLIAQRYARTQLRK